MLSTTVQFTKKAKLFIMHSKGETQRLTLSRLFDLTAEQDVVIGRKSSDKVFEIEFWDA